MRVNPKRCIMCTIALVVAFKMGRLIFSNEIESENDEIFNFELIRDDSKWLQNMVESRSYEIPTVVVEEHFEVLQYWFQAADLGVLPKSKNVLLHIDGHVDGTIPYNIDVIPWFRPPKDYDEVFLMMQRNDMFIVAAALSGLIDHIIWVWPTWDDSPEEDLDWTHLKFDVEIGIAETVSTDGQALKVQNICYCWTDSKLDPEESENLRECHIRSTDCIEYDGCPPIARDQCKIQSHAVVEIVGESTASDILSKEKWSKERGLILDIDEDYFGCWSDVIPLYEAGITQEDITALSDYVSSLFCSSNAEDEVLVDRIYVAIIAVIKTLKFRSCVAQEEASQGIGCLTLIEIDDFLVQNDEKIYTLIKEKQITGNILCNFRDERLEGFFFQNLFRHLLDFSIEQLELLQQLGICLGVSPSSPNFPSDGLFHVCHGENIPNKTLVKFHLPTEEEIDQRAVDLKKILLSTSKKPNIVSVCRSVRDGYTPKPFSQLIEWKILKRVSSTYRSVNIDNVYYDSNLLGGKDGWHGRSQPLVPYFLKNL